ncbi:MAG TPA: rhodanese-like domain-containing protein [Bacilli bacterium]
MNIIEPEQLKERLSKGEQITIIDVREDEEVAMGMIPGAIHIPIGLIPERLDDISKTEEVVLVCRSGHRSGVVQEYLERNGYTGLKNMVGGMLEWETL